MISDDGPFTLPEVAKMTGLSLRSIERGCRAGRIEHLPIGDGTARRHRRMTRHQVEKLVEARAFGTTVPVEPAAPSPVGDLAAAIAATRQLQARRTGRRRPAA